MATRSLETPLLLRARRDTVAGSDVALASMGEEVSARTSARLPGRPSRQWAAATVVGGASRVRTATLPPRLEGGIGGTMNTTDAMPADAKVAIVTGASRGIGAATARAFARAGAAVVLAARDEDALASVAEHISAAGGRALVVPTDVGDAASVERLVARTVDAYGRLDIAFNNAAGGGHVPTPLAEVAVED